MVGVAFLWGARQPSMCSPAVARLPSGPEPRSSEPLRPSAGAVGPGSLSAVPSSSGLGGDPSGARPPHTPSGASPGLLGGSYRPVEATHTTEPHWDVF